MKKIVVLALFVVALNSCNTEVSIKGKIDNAPNQAVTLEELAIDKNNKIDSSAVKETQFNLKAPIKEAGLYRVKFAEGKYIMLALDKGENIDLKGDWNQLENYTVTGSKGSASLKTFLVNLRQNITDINTLQQLVDTFKKNPTKAKELENASTDLMKLNREFVEYVKQYADTTKSLPCALFSANILNPRVEGPFVKKFYETITTRFPNNNTAKKFSDRFLGNEKTIEESTSENTPKDAKGNLAPDFTSTTPNNTKLTLSALRGKYILLDFWASWCGPCRQENPNVVKAYNMFKSKNFDILGVSLDSDKENWLQAIAKDGLQWQHVSELKGWESATARLYQVESIPTNFLIDPNGNIIATDLRGNDLVQKLQEVLK